MPNRLLGFTAGAEPDDHGLDRSRGGFTTKIHLAAHARGMTNTAGRRVRPRETNEGSRGGLGQGDLAARGRFMAALDDTI